MDAKIIFLGSGGGRKVTATQERATGGFVIKFGKEQIHVDPGPGALVFAKQFGVDVRETTAVLVSHFHVDHSNDVNAVIDAITFGGKDKKGILATGTVTQRDLLSDFHKESIGKHAQLKPGDKVNIGNIIVKATKTFGHDVDTVGFKILTPEFVLGYTSDTSYFKELSDEFKGCNIMIVNTLKPSGKSINGHLSSVETAKLLKEVKPKLAILQHFGRSMLEANPMYEARSVQRESGIQTVAAQDGLIINPISYSANTNQKIVSLY